MVAKEGDVVTLKQKPSDYDYPLLEEMKGLKVKAKAEGQRGQWFCIDCGFPPQNNWQANTHTEEHPAHRLAWRNFETGNLEAP